MLWRILRDTAAVVGTLYIGWLAVSAVMSLEKRVALAEAQVVALSVPLTSPIRCDATTQQCTTSYECKKPKCYVRREK